jgi:osmotically-inducible protein OsmY
VFVDVEPPFPLALPSLIPGLVFASLPSMKKLIFGFLLGLLTGAGGYWYYSDGQNRDFKKDWSRSTEAVEERAKKAGAAIADATTNARITAAVKAKLSTGMGLSALADISVDTTEGLVTLSGTVSSKEEINKAAKIAAETEGVHKVISTLQVKPAK